MKLHSLPAFTWQSAPCIALQNQVNGRPDTTVCEDEVVPTSGCLKISKRTVNVVNCVSF